MFTEANRMKRLPAQFFASLVARINQQIASGHDVINLGQGNPDLPTPDHIVESLRSAVLDPATHRYPPFRGLPELKEAVAEFYLRTHGVRLDPQREVAVLFGGKAGLVEISQIYLNPGDVALVPDPGYPDYWSGVALSGADMYKLSLAEKNRFLPDLTRIPEEMSERAKLLFLNYPNNPTGAIADPPFFADVVNFARRHEVLVVHDFAYGAIGYDGIQPPSFLQTPGAMDVGIEIYTLSKTFNMAGWRVGFAVGRADVIEQINVLQDHYYCSLFPGIQRAAITALTGPQDCVRTLSATYQRRRDTLMAGLNQGGIRFCPPGGSFFVWMPVPPGYTSQSYADALLLHAHVGVAPGLGFGDNGDAYVRIGLLTSEQRLAEAADRIAALSNNLRT